MLQITPGLSSALRHRRMGLRVPPVRRGPEAARYRPEPQLSGGPWVHREGSAALRSSLWGFPGIGRMRKQGKEISWVKEWELELWPCGCLRGTRTPAHTLRDIPLLPHLLSFSSLPCSKRDLRQLMRTL